MHAPPLLPPNAGPKSRPNCSKAFSQAVYLQRLMIEDASNAGVKPVVRAALARAWCELEDSKRKLRMKPLPKSVDPVKYQAAQAQARARNRPPRPKFTPVEPEPAPTDPGKEATWEMKDRPGFPGAQVMVRVDSPLTAAPAAANSSSIPPATPPTAPAGPKSQPVQGPKPAPKPRPSSPPLQVYPIRPYGP
jgi:hypothetical protein